MRRVAHSVYIITPIQIQINVELMSKATCNKKLSCRYNSRSYWLSLIFKVIQGRWLLFYLKGRMQFPISDR